MVAQLGWTLSASGHPEPGLRLARSAPPGLVYGAPRGPDQAGRTTWAPLQRSDGPGGRTTGRWPPQHRLCDSIYTECTRTVTASRKQVLGCQGRRALTQRSSRSLETREAHRRADLPANQPAFSAPAAPLEYAAGPATGPIQSTVKILMARRRREYTSRLQCIMSPPQKFFS